jgi:hypothetical protein
MLRVTSHWLDTKTSHRRSRLANPKLWGLAGPRHVYAYLQNFDTVARTPYVPALAFASHSKGSCRHWLSS